MSDSENSQQEAQEAAEDDGDGKPDESNAETSAEKEQVASPPCVGASIAPGRGERISEPVAEPLLAIQEHFDRPVYLLLQNGDHHGPNSTISEKVQRELCRDIRLNFDRGTSIALIIDSPGGNARPAYKIARFLQKYCGAFFAVVPRRAKSAATLLSLGAQCIAMDMNAELGPLDAQVLDREREDFQSALDIAQALQRINDSALSRIDNTMMFLTRRSGKKIESLLPHVLKFSADMVRPLVEDLDVVKYTEHSRTVKVAEKYAARLLSEQPLVQNPRVVASRLVENYPAHGFAIEPTEAAELGLPAFTMESMVDEESDVDVADAIFELAHAMPSRNVIGRLQEVTP